MTIIGRKVLEDFKMEHADVQTAVDIWLAEAQIADWAMPLDVKKRYPKASILPDNHVVFDIRGNRYRLKVKISYQNHIVFIQKIGTHDEYLKWK